MTERAALALSPELRRWHEHVRACQASSQTMVAYAKAHRLSVQAFYRAKARLVRYGRDQHPPPRSVFQRVEVGSGPVGLSICRGGSDGREREKPKAAPKEERRERSAREGLDEEIPGSVVNAPLDFELQRLEQDHPYLRERGFTDETIKTFGLGYCHRGLMKGRIVIPLHDKEGALIGYAGRIVDDEAIGNDTPRYLFPGSRERNGTRHEFRKSAFLYNGFRVENPSRLVVVESFTAVWWLTQAGITNVVALMGASCSETQAALLRDLVPEDRSIWLFPDGDKAGERMAEETLAMLAPYRFMRWIKLDEGTQPTDVGKEDLLTRLPVA